MSVDREYSIRISTIADNAAAQQTAQGLQQVGKATEQAGEHAIKFNEHGREMHEVFHKLNQLAPGLGQALKAVLSPEAAPLIGVVVVIELMVKLFEKMKSDAEAFKKTMEETPDLSGVKNSVESIGSALDDADRKAQDFLVSMNQVMSAQKTIAENSTNLLAALEHQKTVEDEIAKAKKEQVAAELELMKQKGQISPEQYDLAKIQLESASAREAAQREVDYLNKAKAQSEKDRDTAAQTAAELGNQEKAAQDRAANADNTLKQAEQRRDHAKQEYEEVTKNIAGTKDAPGLQQKVDEFRGNMYPQLEGMGDSDLRSYLQNLKAAGSNTTLEEKDYRDQIDKYFQLSDKLGDERRQQSGFAGKVRFSEDEIRGASAEKDESARALAELNRQIKENADSAKTLSQKVDELTRKLDEHKDDSRVFDAQDRARRAQALPQLEKDLGADTPQGAAGFAEKYFNSVTRLNQGKGNAGDEQTRQAFIVLSQSTKESDGKNYELMIAVVNELANHKKMTSERFGEIMKRIERARY